MGIDRFLSGKTPDEYTHPTTKVDNGPDRPRIRTETAKVFGDSFVYEVTAPLTEARVVRVTGGKRVIGGGTSREALGRARKNAARGKR